MEGALGAVEGELGELRGLGAQLESWRQQMDAASTQVRCLCEHAQCQVHVTAMRSFILHAGLTLCHVTPPSLPNYSVNLRSMEQASVPERSQQCGEVFIELTCQ